jgi:nitrite reductase/ring-hydroxylating ferredoxin subunit
MRIDTGKPFHDYVDIEQATVDRVIFSDQAIYEMELERIFARAWNFMCHESQIPKPGDFFLNFIGEESVIATRDKKGELQVLLNSCRHRGNAVCRAESGNARSFLCTYHGWTYGLDGQLIGVPGYKDFYHEQLDKSQWGLVSAAKVASYKGWVFATMDPEAPDLEEYLGPVGRIGIDLCASRGDMIAVEGVQKNVIGCNWKLAVDNLFDYYHVAITHASAFMTEFMPNRNAARRAAGQNPMNHRVLLGDYGHAIGGPKVPQEEWDAIGQEDPHPMGEEWRKGPVAQAFLGEAASGLRGQPNIWPNLWLTGGGSQFSLRLPKGAHATEIWWFTFVDKNQPPEVQALRAKLSTRAFGPAGMLEQEDGENWDQSSRATRGPIARRYPLNYQMNLRQGEPTITEQGVPYIDAAINEHGQLWTYLAWAEWMDAESWADLKKNRTPTPLGPF